MNCANRKRSLLASGGVNALRDYRCVQIIGLLDNMALSDPCLQKEWGEWKRGMEEGRRKSWFERMRRWVKVKADDEEEDDGLEEEGEESSEEEEVADEDREEKGEETEVKEALGIEEEEEEGESKLEGLEDDITGGEEEGREMIEGGRIVDLEEEEKEDGHKAGGNEENKEEEMRMKEEKEIEEEEKEGESDLAKELKENKMGAEEEKAEVNEADETADGEEKEEVDASKEKRSAEGKDEVETEVKEKEEMDGEEENGEKETEEKEEGDNEAKRGANESEEEGEEEASQVRKEEDEEEEQNGRYHLEEQFRQQMGRIQVENIQQNQERTQQEDKTVKDSDSAESENDKDSDTTAFENEHFEHAHEHRDEKLQVNENGILRAWISQGRNEEEDKSENLTSEEDTVTETQEEFQDLEESPNDEEAEHSEDEDEDGEDKDGEDEVKICRRDDYSSDVFHALNEFRDSSILTDLTLNTEDGKSYSVHSPVLAAVSSLIWKNLRRIKENNRDNEGNNDETGDGVHTWSVSLDPEVDHVGLEAVVEFAYTGRISCLNTDNVDQIKTAAQKLGALRVLDLCTEEEEKSTKTGVQKKKEGISAAQQMMISLQFIKRLWRDRVGCDVILEAGRASLYAHRVILAVSSDYFRGMFTLGMKESHQPCVTLPFFLASVLEALISCSYSGALPLSWRCVFELTTTALQLQYQPALSLCLNFLQQEINAHSCLDVVSFAEAYELPELLEFGNDFVLRQFQKVACTSKFQDLPAKQLLKYLNSFSLCVPSELVVFKAVVAWIQAKPKIRLRLAKELMKTVHFSLMTFKEFKEVQAQNMWSNHSLAELYEAVFEDFCSNETAQQTQCRIYLPKESLVLIGGDQISEDLGSRSISRELWFGNSLRNHIGKRKAMEWRKLGEMPEPGRFFHEVAVLRGQLYVFGGKEYYGIGDTLNSVYRYDPLQNSWESLAEMQEKRCSFSVVVLDGMIYAIGGYCNPDYIDSVERYCPTTNSWSFTWPLDLRLGGHVAKVSQSQIFVSGGQNDDYLCLASMFLYHPETGSTYVANMSRPRAQHCMETLGECLYVAGGITTDNIVVKDYLACEVYSPANDSWTAFTSLPVPHVGAGSAVLEGKFYILGGYNQEDYSDTKMVHRYNTATQMWENMGKMPGPNTDIRASLLCLPQHLRS